MQPHTINRIETLSIRLGVLATAALYAMAAAGWLVH